MKKLKNAQKTICGIRYPLFTIILNNKGEYCYYANSLFPKITGDWLFFKSKTKSKILNKYTLSFIGIFYNIFSPIIIILAYITIAPIGLYFEGLKNFVLDGFWAGGVRFFNWANIVIIIILSILLLLK